MPELLAHQASGLVGLADGAGPQLIAVVSHGSSGLEQPILWQLCAALSQAHYPVTVLDATTRESADNPGLQQLLDYRFGTAAFDSPAPECTVVPCALGIRQLEDTRQLQGIGHLFAPNTTLILYASSTILASLLPDSGVTPLMCVSWDRESVLSGYLALKRLLLQARLEPLFLNMIDGMYPQKQGVRIGVPESLAVCARNFLGYAPTAITIDSARSDQQRSNQARQLGLRLLERALPLHLGSSGLVGHTFGHAHGVVGRSH